MLWCFLKMGRMMEENDGVSFNDGKSSCDGRINLSSYDGRGFIMTEKWR